MKKRKKVHLNKKIKIKSGNSKWITLEIALINSLIKIFLSHKCHFTKLIDDRSTNAMKAGIS